MPRRPSADPNLSVVAERIGVSISTVSRALRNAYGIHPDTRSRIIKAAEEIGYELPQTRYEAATRPHQVMALAQCGSPLNNSKYLAGMSRASVSLNLSVLSHHVPAEDCATLLDRKSQPPAMRADMVEGLVLIHRWPADVAMRLSQNWPTVSIVHHYPGAMMDHVGIDDRSGMHTLLAHLHAGGHRKIGFFGFCPEMSWACSRFAGYVESLVRLDLSYDQADVVSVSLGHALSPVIFDADSWTDQVARRIKAGVDAWVCSSSVTGLTLCGHLLREGFRVPDDVALASYHGASVAAPADLPVITSTAVVDEELGGSALRRLIHRFEFPEESPRSILIPARLVPGDTTRPVPAAGK